MIKFAIPLTTSLMPLLNMNQISCQLNIFSRQIYVQGQVSAIKMNHVKIKVQSRTVIGFQNILQSTQWDQIRIMISMMVHITKICKYLHIKTMFVNKHRWWIYFWTKKLLMYLDIDILIQFDFWLIDFEWWLVSINSFPFIQMIDLISGLIWVNMGWAFFCFTFLFRLNVASRRWLKNEYTIQKEQQTKIIIK